MTQERYCVPFYRAGRPQLFLNNGDTRTFRHSFPTRRSSDLLRWLDMKGHQNSQGVTVPDYQGDLSALRRYNGKPDIHYKPEAHMAEHEYHPDMIYSRWHATKIIGLYMRMQGYE